MPRNTAGTEHHRHEIPQAPTHTQPSRRLAHRPPQTLRRRQAYPDTMSDIIIPGIGSLEPVPALDNLNLLAPPVAAALTALAEREVATASSALVVAIDPELADTEVMTREFGMDLALSSNCILVASFWPQDRAVEASGMEYGGITPVGVPGSWRLLIDSACAVGWSCIGSGLRRSKLFVTGEVLAALPGAEIVEGLGV